MRSILDLQSRPELKLTDLLGKELAPGNLVPGVYKLIECTNASNQLLGISGGGFAGYTLDEQYTATANDGYTYYTGAYGSINYAYQEGGMYYVTLTANVVPEPSTWAMLLTGAMMGGVGYWRHRRKVGAGFARPLLY